MKNTLVNILMISNDITEVMNMQNAFKSNKVSNPLFIVQSSEEAIGLLSNAGNKENKIEIPCMILLDVNLTGNNAIDFFKQLKGSQQSKDLKILLMTTLGNSKGKIDFLNFTFDGSISKPISFGNFVSAVSSLNISWQLSEQS